MKNELAGRFRIVAVNSETWEERELAPWFDNLITESGLERLGTGGVGEWCKVGSGSAAPNVNDAALGAYVAGTNESTQSRGGATSSAPYFSYHRKTFRFGVGVAAGNLSEVAVGWANGATSIFSRTLIKDSNGNPTTITVLGTEYLDVTYEFRVYPTVTDVATTITISGVSYNCITRPAYVTEPGAYWGSAVAGTMLSSGASILGGAYSGYSGLATGPIGVVTEGPTGGHGSGNDTRSVDPYVANSKKSTGTLVFRLSTGNVVGGAGALTFFGRLGTYQVSFDPPIPKDATKTLTLNIEGSWARKT